MAILVPLVFFALMLSSFLYALAVEEYYAKHKNSLSDAEKKHCSLKDNIAVLMTLISAIALLTCPLYMEIGILESSVIRLNDDSTIDAGNLAYFCTDSCANFSDDLKVDEDLPVGHNWKLTLEGKAKFNPGYAKYLSAVFDTDTKEKYDWPLHHENATHIIAKRYREALEALVAKNEPAIVSDCSNLSEDALKKLLTPEIESIFKQVGYRLDETNLDTLECTPTPFRKTD